MQNIKNEFDSQQENQFYCNQCNKKFNSYSSIYYHNKTKHKQNPQINKKIISETKENSEKKQNKLNTFEKFQLDLEDKIYAFLGQLSQKNYDDSKIQADIEEEKYIGQSNYFQNKIVRTPFENQFNILKQITQEKGFELLYKDITNLYNKLNQERMKWQIFLTREFKDPKDHDSEENNLFSLVCPQSVIRNYKSRGIELNYPGTAIYLIWLGKFCKPQGWKQFYYILGKLLQEFNIFVKDFNQLQKEDKEELHKHKWKKFINYFIQKLKKKEDNTLKKIYCLNKMQIIQMINLFDSWLDEYKISC